MTREANKGLLTYGLKAAGEPRRLSEKGRDDDKSSNSPSSRLDRHVSLWLCQHSHQAFVRI